MEDALQEIIKRLDELDGDDQEEDHKAADDLLLEALEVLGAEDVATAYRRARDERVGFWYC